MAGDNRQNRQKKIALKNSILKACNEVIEEKAKRIHGRGDGIKR